MKYRGRHNIRGLHIEKSHDEGREKGENRIDIPVEDKLRYVHQGKEGTDNDQSAHGIAEAFLEKPPEIDLFRKGDTKELNKYEAH
jgi:hypothetical protein